jgi:hypothetical protein
VNKIAAWFTFAKRVWISLGVGSLVAVLAIALGRPDRAGAFLVCAAIVAEVFHEKRHRRFVTQIQGGIRQHYTYREVDFPEARGKGIEVTAHRGQIGKTSVNTNGWPLYDLARED